MTAASSRVRPSMPTAGWPTTEGEIIETVIADAQVRVHPEPETSCRWFAHVDESSNDHLHASAKGGSDGDTTGDSELAPELARTGEFRHGVRGSRHLMGRSTLDASGWPESIGHAGCHAVFPPLSRRWRAVRFSPASGESGGRAVLGHLVRHLPQRNALRAEGTRGV